MMEEQTEDQELLNRGMTAVLVMVDPFTWVAYLEGLPEVNASGGSGHEAFRMLVDALFAQQDTGTHAGLPAIGRIKLVRLSPAC